MVSMVGDYHATCTGFSACESQRKFIGLRAGAGEHGNIKTIGEPVGKPCPAGAYDVGEAILMDQIVYV